MSLLRLIGPQGIAGIASPPAWRCCFVVQKVETRHWRKQSTRFEELARNSDAERARIVADSLPPPPPPAWPTAPTPPGSSPSNPPSTGVAKMISKPASLALALTLCACAKTPPPQRIEAVPQLRHCPAFPLPPEGLLKPPAKTDFLTHRLIATEQAIQLDELIQWVRAQAAVDPSGHG